MNAIPTFIAGFQSRAVSIGGSPVWPFIQVTLLLVVSLCAWRLLFRQRAAVRHALLAIQLVVAPVLVLAAMLEAKPDFTFHVDVPTSDDTPADIHVGTASLPSHTFDFSSTEDAGCSPEQDDGDALICAASTNEVQHPIGETDGSALVATAESAADLDVNSPGGKQDLVLPTASEALQPADMISWHALLLWVWTAGFVVVLLRAVFGAYRLRQKLALASVVDRSELTDDASELLSVGRDIQVRESRHLSMPLAAGIREPVILLPTGFREWSAIRLRSVLAHEVAHVNRFDPIVGLASYVCCAALWFHPLMWIVYSLMRREGEQAADDIALNNGIRPTDYAEQLVSLVRLYGQQIKPLPGAVTMASRSDLHRRVDAVLNRPAASNRSRSFVVGIVAVAVAMPIVAGSVRVDRTQAAEPAATEAEPDAAVATNRLDDLRRREAEALKATKELRQVIDDELATAWQADTGAHHTMTVLFLTKALAQLGQFDAINELRDDVRATGDEALARVVNNYSDGVFTAHMLRRDYVAADKAKSRSQSNATHYGQLSWAIQNRDFDMAEKMMADLEKIKLPKNGKVRYSGLLMLANAQMAIAAHWLEDTERIVPALRRYRALSENKDVSERPFDEDVEWITTDEMFGPYFVMALASCGHAELAESLWDSLEFDKKNPKGLYFSYNTLNLCTRLAAAGDTERSLRIARRDFKDRIPAELYQVLCRTAVRDGDIPAARQFAADFETAVTELAFAYSPPRKREHYPLSDQVLLLDRVSTALERVAPFIRDMQSQDQPELAQSAAALYVKLADRFVDEFENKSQESDRVSLRAHDRKAFRRFKLDVIVGLLPADEVRRFANRQKAFFSRSIKYMLTNGREKPIEQYDLALASLGIAPTSPKPFTTTERMLLVKRLMSAGNPDGAKAVFRFVEEIVTRVDRASAVSGSAGGRVVNVATQYRYQAAQMATMCGELDAGIAIIDLLTHRGERVDGYRVLAKAHAEATDMSTAFKWAKSLDDSDLRLAAFTGILQTEAAKLENTEPDELRLIIDEVKRFGEPFIFWGC